MTSEELEALEKLEKAATPGPWDVFADVDLCVYNVIGPAFAPIAVVRTRTIDDPPAEDDDGGHSADFAASSLIVALRNAAPALIAAARENADIRGKLAEAEEVASTWKTTAMYLDLVAAELEKSSDNMAAENARLRAVVEAARELVFPGVGAASLNAQHRKENNRREALISALSALDAKGGVE